MNSAIFLPGVNQRWSKTLRRLFTEAEDIVPITLSRTKHMTPYYLDPTDATTTIARHCLDPLHCDWNQRGVSGHCHSYHEPFFDDDNNNAAVRVGDAFASFLCLRGGRLLILRTEFRNREQRSIVLHPAREGGQIPTLRIGESVPTPFFVVPLRFATMSCTIHNKHLGLMENAVTRRYLIKYLFYCC